jgi:hypothetical protein
MILRTGASIPKPEDVTTQYKDTLFITKEKSVKRKILSGRVKRQSGEIHSAETTMAKSGQRSEHMPQTLHFSISALSGGKYPREFIFLDFLRILGGQNSTQIPHPLQYLSST